MVLRRRFSDEPSSLSLLAQIELASGSPVRAAELYQRLAQSSPGFTEITNLGLAFLLMGRFAWFAFPWFDGLRSAAPGTDPSTPAEEDGSRTRS
jgi:hypothetical protein